MKGALTGMACIAKERGELEEGEDMSENFGREEACKRDEEVRERDRGGTFLSFRMGPLR